MKLKKRNINLIVNFRILPRRLGKLVARFDPSLKRKRLQTTQRVSRPPGRLSRPALVYFEVFPLHKFYGVNSWLGPTTS